MQARSIAMRCMSDERFSLDTNILIYAHTDVGSKHRLAIEIIERASKQDCHLTLQALSEFYAAITRKGIMRPADAASQIEDWLLLFPVLAPTAAAVRAALAHAAAGRASYWDALLVATAAEGGCTSVLSEDMAGGARLGTVAIVNPFGGERLTPEAARLLSSLD